jgi:CheY-like chemotaxis protein
VLAATPVLVLLDLQLLDMDGQEFLSMLRQIPSLRTIPIVVFTSFAIQEEANDCYTLGANSCIQKLHTSAEYVSVLSRLLEYWGHVIVAPRPSVSMAST